METVRFGVPSSYSYFSVCHFDTEARVRTRSFVTALDSKLNLLPIVSLIPLPLFPILSNSNETRRQKKRCCITPRCVLCKASPLPSGFQLVASRELYELRKKVSRCHCKGIPLVNIYVH